MSLSEPNPCAKCSGNCTCERLALAIEVVHREIVIENNCLKRKLINYSRWLRQETQKLACLRKTHADTEITLNITRIEVANLKREAEENRKAYEEVNNVWNYCALLEDFIHKNTVPYVEQRFTLGAEKKRKLDEYHDIDIDF